MHPTEFFSVPVELRKEKKLSILLPFLNESKIIVQNTHEVLKIMTELDFNFEIVLIDDGSKDNSYEMLQKEFKGNPLVKIARNYQNFGKGWALKTGYEYSSGDYVLFLDSDLELSPRHIPNFYRVMLETGADAVIGSKLHKDSLLFYPLKRRIMSFFYYSLIKLFFGLPIMDTQTGIKLFKREALELSLPKVLVKKFAFDIELLLILNKNKKLIQSAPIELNFSRGKFGNIRFKTILNTFNDTFAVFYRDKFLRFYDRPLGENKKYFYSIILFSDRGDDYEKESLLKFLNINYSQFEVILIGKTDFGMNHQRLKFVYSDEHQLAERFKKIQELGCIQGEIVVFSKLEAYPDERFLFCAGRILSLSEVGAAGGFVTLRNPATGFEEVSYAVKQSVFINLEMNYRYKPVNYKEVSELQLNGFFIERTCLEGIDYSSLQSLKLEYVLSKQVKKAGLKMVYTPDIMLYSKFQESPEHLIQHFKTEAYFRSFQFKSKAYKAHESLLDKKFILSIGFILIIFLSVFFCFWNKTFWGIIPLAAYYLFLAGSRFFLYGIKKGFKVFLFLTAAQVVYGIFFLAGLLKKNEK